MKTNEHNPTVRDIMTKKVISVRPDTPILEVHKVIFEHNFSGVPVADKSNRLVGLVTEYDLITKGSAIHLPTFQKVISELRVYSKDKRDFRKDIAEITKLTAQDVMNDDPLTVSDTANLAEVIDAFQKHHRVNPILVVDNSNKVVGVVSRYDVLKVFEFIK